ncbi:glycogen debranching protein GlgX [Pinibacter aurantiacus]|uniref:Glycogen debranching protein GlgX n=1 Tax=Pinibacter aurantiacus TaxID=2851599 RepID=A0A9E2S655_9BACT|nr:glycogen debranching protein GlgX [Pinibacter aurantiacus]MBV4356766.1 glycogen debranching protein GlgX [Pinibacter aurantiacus]
MQVAKKYIHEHGETFPLGSTIVPGGVNFSLFCKNGTAVELLLFDNVEAIEPNETIKLDPQRNRTDQYWHIFVPGLQSGQLYAYRIDGPNEPAKGHRYDVTSILLDPYANVVAVPEKYNRRANADERKRGTPAMKSAVVDLSLYAWENDKPIERSFAETVIYELHTAGFTLNPNSNIDEGKRGTYKGVIEKIPYLKELGITAVELLPVFQFDAQDSPEGMINYWGYSPVSFFAPHQAYSSSKDHMQALDDFRDMVKALHKANIEVILDVVFNHTAEGNHGGPSFCYRGIDNSVYYLLEKDKQYYSNFSGTGNTLNANQPIVRRMIIDSLRFWVSEMHVDGFRFDLASILSRDEKGMAIENPPVLWDIDSDPELAGTKLIAEAWDAAGLYQVGSFAGDRWKEWNGVFRDDLRKFMRGDENVLSPFVTRLIGSPDIYSYRNRGPEQSINFITCHDGFTLNDLVSYNQKHNEANRENNQDGCNDNCSYNFGVEGPTDDPDIETMRNRQVKNFLALTLLSIGTPMILMGDEVRRTQNGNNNAYCQNNELSWFDWSLVDKHAELLRFTKKLIGMRLQRDMSQAQFEMTLNQLLDRSTIHWHGIKINAPDWSPNSHSIAITVESLGGKLTMHFMLNAHKEALEFELPEAPPGVQWKRWIDTSLASPDDICERKEAKPFNGRKYKVEKVGFALVFWEK